jgi:hypothetical protein
VGEFEEVRTTAGYDGGDGGPRLRVLMGIPLRRYDHHFETLV